MRRIGLFGRALALLAAIGAALVVSSCGGGPSAVGTTFSSVAMAGELLDYTVDTGNLTYSYTITESQFGLTGKTGSGTLVRNADGSYSPSGVPGARVVVLPNGLLLGAVRESFGASPVTVPVIGLSSPVATLSAITGDYNYIHRDCLLAGCGASHGTFRIGVDGIWTSCRDANIASGSCTGASASGTLESRGNGLWRVLDGSTDIGTAIGFASAGQNVIVVDLKDTRAGGFGIGILVGGQQTTMTTAQTDGTWIAGTSAGHWGVFTASGATITLNLLDGIPLNLQSTFTANSPWTGLATTSAGGVGFMAGGGVYVLETAGGDAELGIKIR
jgi:hypothetical protein